MQEGGGALSLDSKVIGMLVVFLGYKILILIFFRVFRKILCRNEILVFWGSAHFPYRVKMKNFRKVFNKLEKNCSSNCDQVVQLNDFFYLGFYRVCLFADGWETRYFDMPSHEKAFQSQLIVFNVSGSQ